MGDPEKKVSDEEYIIAIAVEEPSSMGFRYKEDAPSMNT